MLESKQEERGFFSKFRYAFAFLLIVSTVMLRFSKIFSTQTGMSHPQFGFKGYNPTTFKNLTSYLSENYFSFKGFFFADMFYLLALWWVMYTLFKKIKPRKNRIESFRKQISKGLIGLGIISVVADVIENLSYWTGNLWLPAVESIKTASMALLLVSILLYAIINIKSEGRSLIKKFLRSGYISIIILVLIGFGLTLLPQGATLIVHLFEAGSIPGLISIVCSVFFVNVLAIILSIYPKYLEFRISNEEEKVDWHMTEQKWGFGIITYKLNKSDDSRLVLGRYSLGILVYIAWFYIMYKAFALYGLTWFEPLAATTLLGGLYLIVAGHYFLKFRKERSAFYSKLFRGTLEEADLSKIRKWVKLYIIWMISTFIFGLICLGVYYTLGWHIVSFIFSLCFIFCNASCFILFRFTRVLLVFAKGNFDHIKWVNEKDFKEEQSNAKMEAFFNSNSDWSYIFKGKVWDYFIDFSSNYIFLRRLQLAGFVSLFLLLASNLILVFGNVTIFSSIPILLAFLVNFYVIIILYVKHLIFYDSSKMSRYFLHKRIKESPGIDMKGIELTPKEKDKFVLKKLVIMPLAILIVLFGLKGVKNFHKMNFVDTKSYMRVDDYKTHLEKHTAEKNINRLAKVASFGGGLKSNLWNLLVLNKLESEVLKKDGKRSFLDYCFSFSGVSGGAVGLGNYLALDFAAREKGLVKMKAIEDIGNENVLSIDMAGLLVHDFVMGSFKIAGNGRNKDRSYYAMERYIEILSNGNKECKELLSETSQQDAWYEMYKSRGHIPALIINTASTGPFPGVAFSLESEYLEKVGEKVFPGYILLEENEKDLRYYDAISTSNRFPIMSPSAQVDHKGFFLDGGYFENSGLLTSSYFQRYLQSASEKLDTTPVITINVINSKSDYIRKFIDTLVTEDIIINSATNISAIISGVTDINKLPNVLRSAEGEYVEGGDKFMSIYLPHMISTADIESLLGGTVKFTPKILKAITENNNKVRNAIQTYARENNLDLNIATRGIVEPPLARTLSKYAVIYQQAMISNFDGCLKEVEEIVDWLSK